MAEIKGRQNNQFKQLAGFLFGKEISTNCLVKKRAQFLQTKQLVEFHFHFNEIIHLILNWSFKFLIFHSDFWEIMLRILSQKSKWC